MNTMAIDSSEHGGTTPHRSSWSYLRMALVCLGMTFPLLASAFTVDDVDPPAASPGATVTLTGSGFSEPAENYAIVVVGPAPTAAVELRVLSITGPLNAQVLTLEVGEAEGPFQGELFVLEGDEIEIHLQVFENGDRAFAVQGSRFSAISCQYVGRFGIDFTGDGGVDGLTGAFELGVGSSSSQKQGGPVTGELLETVWAQAMGDRLEFFLRPSPYPSSGTTLSHMIDPEDCAGRETSWNSPELTSVSAPGQIQMTYLSGDPDSAWDFAEDLATAMQYAFQSYEGVSADSGGPWVTVELGREARGDSILLQIFRSARALGPD